MCGRYSLTSELTELAERFGFAAGELAIQPRFNVAPSQPALTVISAGRNAKAPGPANRAGFMRWGLIPAWAKDAAIGNRLINARAETLTEKPSFRRALERRRCLVLADGFYEWQKVGRKGQPFRITLASGEPFGLAGLWERWQAPSGETVNSCTIITTAANQLLAPIHHRMPVILSPHLETAWLDPDVSDTALLGSMLAPYPAEGMQFYPVSPLVNSTAHDSPDCITPIPAITALLPE